MFRQIISYFSIIILFFLSLFLYTKLAGPFSFSVNSITTQKTDTFNVTGEGKTSIAPDIAVLNVGVTAQSATVKGAQDQINLVINKVTTEVQKLGVVDKDIQTSNYSINPTYDYTSGSQKVAGFTASTNLTIKVKELDKINQVIDAASASGANQINGLSFDVADRTKAENEAREEAVADAKKKAQAAAKIGGFNLGKLVNYTESSTQPPTVYPQRGGLELASDASKTTEVQPGSLEVTISVTLSYQIQ